MVIRVNIGAIEVARSPEVLETLLGSCVALMLYDRDLKIGGMAHIVYSHTNDPDVKEPGKYANTAVPALINRMSTLGAKTERLVAKIAGGATMFRDSVINIGKKNVKATKKLLRKYNIRIVGEDVGGYSNRYVKFFLEDGKVVITYGGTPKLYNII